MAVGILTIRSNTFATLDFKTESGIQMGVPFRRPNWADGERYAVLLSLNEEDDYISNLKILTYLEVY